MSFRITKYAIALAFTYLTGNGDPISFASEREFAAMIADGYEANFAALSFHCRFHLRTGSAESIYEASRGNITELKLERHCEWLSDGENAKFIVECSKNSNMDKRKIPD